MNRIEIYGINGPLITVWNDPSLKILEMVKVGSKDIIGEVISIGEKFTKIQVYEDTGGLSLKETVTPLGTSLSINLGPGLIGNIFDGIARPLTALANLSGAFMSAGANIESLNLDSKWEVEIFANVGERVWPCKIIACVKENSVISHKIMVPNGIDGTIKKIVKSGTYKISKPIAEIETNDGIKEIHLFQKWPIRTPRPCKRRHRINQPLATGQRVIDTLFPIAKGGTTAIPGGFGTGKTMTQHQLAKWSDADVIIYIGCGERGNEMTQVLEEFSQLTDPKTNRKMMDRTILIANTSNMPVASREASIYTGITMAEYFRDMGMHVAVMADSTSRWAEALREISGRLEEMPAEEGFPAYLPSRLSEFYERAGYVTSLNDLEGSVSIIGAVSPQGGDFSEPVTQNTKRFVRCFWALDKNLAYSRHYPAINWLDSYSEYADELSGWYERNISPNFSSFRSTIIDILSREKSLMEIVKLVGSDVLPEEQKLVLDIAAVIRIGFLQQNAYHELDSCTPISRQFEILKIIINLNKKCEELVKNGISVAEIKKAGIFSDIIKLKYELDDESDKKLKDLDDKISDLSLENYKN